MESQVFGEYSPGKLVPTTGWNREVRNGLQHRVAAKGFAFVPDPLPPKLDWPRFIGEQYPAISAAETALARLDATAAGLANPDLISDAFKLREVKLSSRIENTIASVEEVALVAAEQPPSHDDAREVWNNLEALRHGLASPLPLCNRLFNQMHGILLSGVRGEDKQPGEFRDVQNYIKGDDERFESARFVPPPPGESLSRCLTELEHFLNRGGADLPRVVRAALSHYQFECIHPYRDGNGRLGRLLVALNLCKDGSLARPLVYVSAYFAEHKDEYFDLLLRVSTRGDWAAWIKFFCDAISTQANDGIARAARLTALREDYVARVTTPKASALLPKVVGMLFHRPAIRANDVIRGVAPERISTQTARNLLQRLEEKKIVVKHVSEPENIFIARGVLAAIEDDLPAK